MLPVIDRLIDLECGNEALCSGWELRNSCYVFVVPLVIDDFCERVTHLESLAVPGQEVLETVFLVRVDAADGGPPATCSLVAFHSIVGLTLPVAEITHCVAIVAVTAIFVLVVEYEGHAAVAVAIDAETGSGRHGFLDHRIRNERFEFVFVIGNIRQIVLSLLASVLAPEDYT